MYNLPLKDTNGSRNGIAVEAMMYTRHLAVLGASLISRPKRIYQLDGVCTTRRRARPPSARITRAE